MLRTARHLPYFLFSKVHLDTYPLAVGTLRQ